MTTDLAAPNVLRRTRRRRSDAHPASWQLPGSAGSGPSTRREARSSGASRWPSDAPTARIDVVSAPHWRSIDGLRGVAVAGVVAYHLGWISGGFLGVDLFFALSGFLITTLLVREHRASGSIDLVSFWGRRFRRLLPAVMALIVAVVVWTTIWGTPAEQAGARGDARWAIPYLANWHQVAGARDYWAASTDASVFTHLWSLAIEEQFYVVWPLVCWWALRSASGERRLARVATVGLVGSVLAMVVLHDPASPSRVYLGTDTRAGALLLGSLVALNPVHRRLCSISTWRPTHLDRFAMVAGVGLLAWWTIGGRNLDLLLGGGLVIHSAVAAGLVAAVAAAGSAGSGRRGGRVPALLDRPWLVWLGERSYGVYLWHWPVILLARPRWTGLPDPIRDVAMGAVSLALAEVSFRLLEHPVRRRTGWATGGRAAVATAAVTAVAVLAAVVAPSGRGQVASFELDIAAAPVTTPAAHDSERPPATPTSTVATDSAVEPIAAAPIATEAAKEAATDAPLQPAIQPATAPGLGAGAQAGAAPSPLPRPAMHQVLWLGDSVAADLAPALTAAFGAAGVTWVDGSGDGLRFTPGGGVDPVAVHGARFDAAPFDVTPFDTVVLQLSYWDSPADAEQLRASFGWLHDQVVARDAQLVIVTPPPVRADLVDQGMSRQVEVVGELVALDPSQVVLVDAAVPWGSQMAVDIDGDLAPDRKPDGVHVCPQGAARFAAWLVAEMAGRFDGVAPAPSDAWLGGAWTASERYDTPTGACAPLG